MSSIADFLLSDKQQTLLSKLLLNPDKSFTYNELVRLAGPGRGGGQRELQRLLDARVVKDVRVGRQRMISANTEFLLFDELRAICVKSFGVADIIKKVLAPLAESIQEAFIFGSIAKGTAGAESDVDLLIVGEVTGLALANALYDAEQAIGRSVHLTHYDPDEWNTASQDIVVQSILAGPRIEVVTHGE